MNVGPFAYNKWNLPLTTFMCWLADAFQTHHYARKVARLAP